MITRLVKFLGRYSAVREFYHWRVRDTALTCARVDANLSILDPPMGRLTRGTSRLIRGVLERYDPSLAARFEEIRREQGRREYRRRWTMLKPPFVAVDPNHQWSMAAYLAQRKAARQNQPRAH